MKKLSNWQIAYIKKMQKMNFSIKVIAKNYNVSPATIYRIIKGTY